jgi:hypothetical protein
MVLDGSLFFYQCVFDLQIKLGFFNVPSDTLLETFSSCMFGKLKIKEDATFYT